MVPEDDLCHRCGQTVREPETDPASRTLAPGFERILLRQYVRFSIVTLAIIASVWALLDFLLPSGWPTTLVNIVFFLLTVFFGVVLLRYLSALVPRRIAWVVAGVIYFLVVFLLRSIELEVLSAVFGRS